MSEDRLASPPADTERRAPSGAVTTQSLRSIIDAALRISPAQPVFHWRASRALAVLAYHEIRDPDRFATQLDHLCRDAHPVSLAEVIGAIEGRSGLPARAVLVTFDDGHRDVIDIAMPLLRERGIPAVAFVVAGLIDTDRPHWWTEVKDLIRADGRAPAVEGLAPEAAVRALKVVPDALRRETIAALRRTATRPAQAVSQLTAADLRRLGSEGVAIGNHSLTHPCLSRCDVQLIQHEVDASQEVLARLLGHEVESFAYPDGDRDERVTGVVRNAGIRAAFAFDHRLSDLRPPDPLHVSRLRIDADASLKRFRIVTSGLHPAVHRLRGLS
jgi:peptidoglycan/xylan/chitin deacetylase (PgdA/CDA1 family)